MNLDAETLRILAQDAAFRAQFQPVEELKEIHGLEELEAELVVGLAQHINEEIEAEVLRETVNWKKEGF